VSGRLHSYTAILEADALGHAIAQAIRESEFGPDVTRIDYRVQSDRWPFVEAFFDVEISWPVTLAYEAQMTT